jgi:hypothetical protein
MTTPHDLFQARKAKALRGPHPKLVGTWGQTHDEVGDEFDFVRHQYRRLFNRFPGWLQDTLKDQDRFWIGELPVGRDKRNGVAWSEQAENGGHLVVLTTGLMLLIYKVCRALVTGVETVRQGESIPASFPREVVADRIRVTLSWMGRGIPYGPDFPITPSQAQLADLVATYAEWFVMCHEIAHVHFHRRDPSRKPQKFHRFQAESVEGEGVVEELIGQLLGSRRYYPVVTREGIDITNDFHAEEFAADERGLDYLLSAVGTENGDEQARLAHAMLSWAGAYVVLAIDEVFTQWTRKPELATDSHTHPPSWQRVDRLRDYLKSLIKDEDKFKTVEQVASGLHGCMWPVIQDSLSEPVSVDDQWKDDFEEVWRSCAEADTPQFLIFHMHIGEMLNSTAGPRVFLYIQDIFDKMKTGLPSGGLERLFPHDSPLVRFHRFKLLASFCMRLPGPLRDLIAL